MLAWLTFSLALLGAWLLVFTFRPRVRKEMFWVSLFTMPFGLTEPLFIPRYWNPPSLFNLAATTHFDVESLIFCFASGGIASVMYEAVFHVQHQKLTGQKLASERRLLHKLAIIAPVPIFIVLDFSTSMNPIYSLSIAMFTAAIITLVFRPDLAKKVSISGLMFVSLYIVFFLCLTLVSPQFIDAWNLSALTGIMIFNVPVEELIFAFTFGMLWSSFYEHILGYRLLSNLKAEAKPVSSSKRQRQLVDESRIEDQI